MAFFETDDLSKVFVPPTGAGGAVLPIIGKPGGGGISAEAGTHGGLAIEGVAGGTAVPVSGTVTATVDTSALATQATVSNLEGASVPASATGVVTKSDATIYDPPLRFLTATGAGDIALVLSGSASTITLTVAANERITSLLISKVMSTGTTATGISGAA